MSQTAQAKYRLDYQSPAWTIATTDLEVTLSDHQTRVVNQMQLQQLRAEPLVLQGENLQLVELKVDGQALSEQQYKLKDGELVVHELPKSCELTVVTELDPANNASLEGLYKSAGSFCTQCEAEGFRRITYYLDRPDVLAVFTTTIRAPKAEFPYLLSNGNQVAAGEEPAGWHWVTWHDPHPKPCYLFALVAGDFDLLEDVFTTREGRDVQLQMFVDKGNVQQAQFAMRSLQESMKWDEERFGLVYDLDIYMVVAVDFFNMGAMENKGLNVFNSRFVLADPKTATDQDYLNVESVIGHEYFHNWTGNRITCRDWFQLSLKEGLTVFRDQEFSSDLRMRAVNRIQDARIIRTHQFEEDASPMAHPIRPDKVVEMNNFYTVTVYNKGAEVIRMLHTLLGEEQFQQGMQLYIERFDGMAVTCDDFVQAMADASGRDLSQFSLWYSQAGTPQVTVRQQYNANDQQLYLTMHQHIPATPGQPTKQPMHIPIRVEFFTQAGQALELRDRKGQPVDLLELTEEEQTFELTNATSEPIAGLLADFSAPIRLDYPIGASELSVLAAAAEDPFLRWDSVQQLYLRALKRAIEQDAAVELPENLIDALATALSSETADPALVALLLQPPGEATLAGEYQEIPVDAIHRVTGELQELLALSLKEPLLAAWQRTPLRGFNLEPESVGRRLLGNTALRLLAAFSEDDDCADILACQFREGENMTLQHGALLAAVHNDHPLAPEFLREFASQWQGTPLVMDKWLHIQATAPLAGTCEKVTELTAHPAFDWRNPNRIYSLLAAFGQNLGQLHRADGAGYQILQQAITRLNTQNPQVASRLLSPLLKWRRLDPVRQEQLRTVLEQLRELPDLAPDLQEKLEQSLL